MKFPRSRIDFWAMFSGEPWLFRSWRRFGLVILLSLVTPTFLLLIYTSRTVGNRLERHALGELQVLDSLFERQIAEELVGISRYVESFASRRTAINSTCRYYLHATFSLPPPPAQA